MGDIVLSVENLRKEFRGVTAVDDLSFHLEKGKIYGLIGTNGAGKSTVINILSGNQRATSGRVVFCGKAMDRRGACDAARSGISRTFQNLRIFGDMTVLDNVRTASQLKTSYRLLDLFLPTGRVARAERRTNDAAERILDTMRLLDYRNTRAGDLPYGLQRRLEIARCLAIDPSLLLLDEPAAGMNPAESMALEADIRSIHAARPDCTILLIEHDMRFVMSLCEYIFLMASGRLQFEGTPEAARASAAVTDIFLGGGILAAS